MAEAKEVCKTKTMTITETNGETQPLVLKLKKPRSDKKVQWEEGVIDNEFMGKKSSKCCCIYTKPRKFGDSDTESDSDGDDDDCCHEHRMARRRIPRSDPNPPGPSSEGPLPSEPLPSEPLLSQSEPLPSEPSQSEPLPSEPLQSEPLPSEPSLPSLSEPLPSEPSTSKQ